MHRKISLNEGDILISDSHESLDKKGFLGFLKALKNHPKKPKNLFLCGDMFDLLVPNINLHKVFFEQIRLINELSDEMNVIYLEGNHDFELSHIFPNVQVIKREKQPILLSFGVQTISISHGDIFLKSSFYDIYSKIIRSITLLKFLNVIDLFTFFSISNAILSKQSKKIKCKEIQNFREKISPKIEHYAKLDVDVIIEGHYHQNKKFDFDDIKYINLSSFACSQSFFIVQSSDGKVSLVEVKSL